MENENRISFSSFHTFAHNYLVAAKRLFWIPIVLALLFGAFKYLRVSRSYVAEYESKAVFAVRANYAGATDISTYSYYFDSNAAGKMAATFPHILSTDATKQLIAQKLDSPTIPAKIAATSVADSNLFVITSTAYSPQEAYDVLNAVVSVYPQAAANIIGSITMQAIESPTFPSAPKVAYDPVTPTLKYAAVGLLIGLLILAVFALLRQTVHSSEDLHRLINVPCLSFLPNVQFKKRSSTAEQVIAINNPKISPGYLEAVRTMRFKLKKELDKCPGKVIMVTSTLPGEGKTTVSANLALSLAEQGNRVILVDADLRRQSLKAMFCIDTPSEGLIELISNKGSQAQPIAVPNSSLLLLCGDKIADHPQSFLSSARMQRIVASLKEQMDYVIIDTPPAAFLSDAATLAECVDCALYVVRQDYASRTSILNSIQSLVSMDIRFVGCVLNNTSQETTKYGYGYGRYGYGNGYGYGNYGSESYEEDSSHKHHTNTFRK